MKQRGEGEVEREVSSIASRIAFTGTLGCHRLYDKWEGWQRDNFSGRKQREITCLVVYTGTVVLPICQSILPILPTLMGSVWSWGQSLLGLFLFQPCLKRF